MSELLRAMAKARHIHDDYNLERFKNMLGKKLTKAEKNDIHFYLTGELL